jgi:hypothetical protein
MEIQFNILKILKTGKIESELDFERALIADRKLRVLCKTNPSLKPIRENLINLIEVYEEDNWSDVSNISSEKILESDVAELVAEQERISFYAKNSFLSNVFPKL